MKKQLRVGLVVEGNATASAVLRLRGVVEELGPIKSVGLQVARRTSNFLRAGYGVTEYRDLEFAKLVLLRLPDDRVPRVVVELCEANLPFSEMAFVLCETWQTADVLSPLRQRGAAIASVVNARNVFVLEGDPPAVRKLKRLLERGGARAIELRPGTKPLYFAANLLSTAIPVPLFQLAQQALRDSGVAGNDLAGLMNDWTDLLGQSVRKGGRAAWGGPLAECSEGVALEQFRQLEVQDPALAGKLHEWLAMARPSVLKQSRSAPQSLAPRSKVAPGNRPDVAELQRHTPR